ncbi:flagellin [Sinorhizobium sp. BG8]|uniref:flagellin N-terminal helical domain-containing protein n=1 Tax=Sinorhizobium sp. BG8 TaxID=2613773 RepID=UPI00193CDE12|nr:flagellin [Sinorhizobium sp. BG8]QRM54239.1 flagellin [Sinorhizobium sp. BG8]
MTSILTNTAAMGALATLRSINSGLEETQNRVSSGLRVDSASDNAAYWSIATTMRSDNSALAAVEDAIGLGAAKVDTAYAGMESAIDVVTEIKAKLVAATEDGVDKAKVQEEIDQLQDQLTSIAESAAFSGENWIQADITTTGSVTKSVVSSFVRDSSGSVSVKKVDYTLDSSTVLFDEGANATTGYGAGILDSEALFTGTDGITVSISVNGIESDEAVKGYSTDELMALTGMTFTASGSQTVATDGTDSYLQVDGEKWVLLTTTAPTTGQSVAYNDGTTDYFVDTGNTPTNVTSANAGFSVYDLDITDLATVATAMGGSFTEEDALDFMIQFVDTALSTMTSAAADLGSISTRIDLQEEFISSLTDSIDSGVGRLVDADMNEESTRLSALQTQQSLAIQALSIANSSSENILQLFR